MKTFEEIKQNVSDKAWEIKWKIEDKAKRTIKWCEENKELAIAMIPVGVVAIKEIGKVISSVDRKIDLAKEQELQDLYVYDHSLGMYHRLRRPMKPEEKIELSIRVKHGETKLEVLRDMRLL